MFFAGIKSMPLPTACYEQTTIKSDVARKATPAVAGLGKESASFPGQHRVFSSFFCQSLKNNCWPVWSGLERPLPNGHGA